MLKHTVVCYIKIKKKHNAFKVKDVERKRKERLLAKMNKSERDLEEFRRKEKLRNRRNFVPSVII